MTTRLAYPVELEITSDQRFFTAYVGGLPAATLRRARIYSDEPAWSAYDTNGAELFTCGPTIGSPSTTLAARLTTALGAQRRRFPDTGWAYDTCQCDETIRDGMTLIVESEQVVGLAGTWPVAVTAKAGKLHTVADGRNVETIVDATRVQIRAACATAVALGYELAPAFQQFAPVAA